MFVASGGTDGSVVEVRNEATGPAGDPEHSRFTDPPSDYRMPDPTAPVVIADKPKKKKFRWWWQD